MSVPIYYIADCRTELSDVFDTNVGDPVARALDWWRRMGLGPIVEDHGGRIACSRCNGPDGTTGIWVTVWPEHGERPKPLGYHPDRQTWVKVRNEATDSPAVYVGHAAGQRPTPSDLANGNPHGLSGPDVKLCDGQSWTIAEIREPLIGERLLPTPIQQTALPTLIGRDLDGNLARPVKPQFQQLWEASGDWFDVWCEIHFTDRNTFDSIQALEFCLQVLQLRYRICDYTNDAFGLLDTQNFQQSIEAAIGWPAVRRFLESQLEDDAPQKKTTDSATAANVNGNFGPGDCGHSTGHRAANSGLSPAASTTPTDSDGGH
jgi:hypothetical protein